MTLAYLNSFLYRRRIRKKNTDLTKKQIDCLSQYFGLYHLIANFFIVICTYYIKPVKVLL